MSKPVLLEETCPCTLTFAFGLSLHISFGVLCKKSHGESKDLPAGDVPVSSNSHGKLNVLTELGKIDKEKNKAP